MPNVMKMAVMCSHEEVKLWKPYFYTLTGKPKLAALADIYGQTQPPSSEGQYHCHPHHISYMHKYPCTVNSTCNKLYYSALCKMQ